MHVVNAMLTTASEGLSEDRLDDLGFGLRLAFLEAEELKETALETRGDELLAEELKGYI